MDEQKPCLIGRFVYGYIDLSGRNIKARIVHVQVQVAN